MKNVKMNKTWMTIIIFAGIMIAGAAWTYFAWVSGYAERWIEVGARIWGNWYANYAQWFWSKWYMIAIGYGFTALGAAIISWQISDMVYNK